jgi:O-antigen/teichoic acid export membrane protein
MDMVVSIYNKAILYSLMVSTILSFLVYVNSNYISVAIFQKPKLEVPLNIMSLSIIPVALYTLHAHALQGLKKIASSVSILSVIVPLITSVIVLLFVPTIGIKAAVYGYLFATIINLLIGRWLWWKETNKFYLNRASFKSKSLMSTSIPLLVIVLVNMIMNWSPMLILGIWESSVNVGIYNAANRTAMLTSFVLFAVNSIAAPKFASLYQQGDNQTLGLIAQNSTKIMIILATPVLMIFLIFPEVILSIFGDEFTQGSRVLMILALGEFINVATGSVGYLLIMTGNEKLMQNNLVISAIFGLTLCLYLIPTFGIIGAAISTALMISMQNIVALILVWRKLKICPIPWINLR